MANLHYRQIVFTCQCGKKAPALQKLGGTEDGCLIAFWYCVTCRRRVAGKIRLEDVIAMLPTKAALQTSLDFDANFLRSAGIKE